MNNFQGGNTKADIMTAISKNMLTESTSTTSSGQIQDHDQAGMHDPKERVPCQK
jgi:hypothetical protein